MKKKILSLILALSLLVQYGTITTFALGLDPYIGFSATAIDDYKCDRPAFTTNKKLGGIWAGDWACYKEIDFGDTSPTSVEISVGVPEGYSKAVELRIDAPDGKRIASVPITPSGAFSTPVLCKAELENPVTGIHDLYITNANSTSDIYDIKFYKPRVAGADIPEFDDSDVYSDISDDENRREINVLYKLGVLRDYAENKFDPRLPVTRAEFAYSVFKLYDPAEGEGSYLTKFTDVKADKYYAQAVMYLSERGIINGITETTFRPDDFIRHVDALAIICRVLDYDVLAQELGGYPNGYLRIASDEKFFVSGIGSADYLRRTDMALMIYKTIEADGLEITGIKNNYSTYEKVEGLLYKTRKLYTGYGKVNTNYLSDLYLPDTDVSSAEVMIDELVYKVGKTDAGSMLGMFCEFYYTEEENGERTLAAIVPDFRTEITEISPETHIIEKIGDDEVVYYSESGKKLRFEIEDNTAVLYNGVAIDTSVEDVINSQENFCGSLTFIKNGDGVNTLIINEYVNYIAGSINTTDEFIIDYYVNETIDLSSESNVVFVKKQDELVALADLEEGDVISLYSSANKTGRKYKRVYVSGNEISGEISQKSSTDNKVVINGAEYKISPYCTTELSVGQNGIFKLDINGYITHYDYADVSDRNIGLYLESTMVSSGVSNRARVKLITSPGKPEVLELAESVTIDGIRIHDGNSAINGTASWAGLAALTTEKPLRYSVNNENEIIWMDTLLTGDGSTDDTLKQITKGDSITHNYQNGIMAITVRDASNASYSVGKYFVPTSATMITYFANARSEEDNWAISTIGSSINDTAYPIGEVYSTFGDDYSGDLFVWRNSHTSTSYGIPFVFTGMTTALDENGDTVYNVSGIDGRAKVSYVLTESAYTSGVLKDALPGDMVRIRLNAENEIFSAEYLVFRDGAASRGTSTAAVSADSRLSKGTSREVRWLFGKAAEKGNEYIAVDLGIMNIDGADETLIELIERSSADVMIVSPDGRNGQYVFDYGLTSQNIAVGDTIFVYLNDGATELIVVYKDVIL